MADRLDVIARRIADVSPEWAAALNHARGAARVVERLRGDDALALGVESIYEGYAIHYAASRVAEAELTPALHLLLGDFCYAAGLCDVAATGDLDAVATLADLIADTAALAAEGRRPADAPDPRELRWNAALSALADR